MLELIIIWGKFVLASALLMAFYGLVLRHKASYRMNRTYLVLVPLFSVMMCGMTFNLPVNLPVLIEGSTLTYGDWTPEAEVPVDIVADLEQSPVDESVVVHESTSVALPHAHQSSLLSTLDYVTLVQWLLLAVSLILLLIGLWYVCRLLRIKSRMVNEKTEEGYNLIRSESVPTPFSFGKTIFLPLSMDHNSEEMILRHEKAHIAHGHYLEVWFVELVVRVFWFNPILWMSRAELRNVHEFEADHDVIDRGVDIHTYQSTLLEMVLNESCPVVNGFNHSFIRQRFIEMKSSAAGTLGRVGKVGMVAWVVVLFCSFTMRANGAKNGSWFIPEYKEAKMFTVQGVVSVRDSAVLNNQLIQVYLGDEYFHIEEREPVATVPIEDNKFHFTVPLTKTTAGRLRVVRKDGKPLDRQYDIFFVPGVTIPVEIGNAYLTNRFASNDQNKHHYYSQIYRTIEHARHLYEWTSPHMSAPKGKVWDQIAYDNESGLLKVRDVCFCPDSTLLRIYPTSEYVLSGKDAFNCLQDESGDLYMVFERANQSFAWTPEEIIFGYQMAFPPLPKGTTRFSLGRMQSGDFNSIYHNIRAKSAKKQKDNFRINITVSPGIDDCAYLINLYEGDDWGYNRVVLAEVPVDEHRQCSFSCHLDSICFGSLQAIFPDGSVCTHVVNFIFVPGETADARVMYGKFQLSGSGFYKEWENALDNFENATQFQSYQESNSKIYGYLKEHKSELGCRWVYLLKGKLNSDKMNDMQAIDELCDQNLAIASTNQYSKAVETKPRELGPMPSNQNDTIPGTVYTKQEYEKLVAQGKPSYSRPSLITLMQTFKALPDVLYQDLSGQVEHFEQLKDVRPHWTDKEVQLLRVERLDVTNQKVIKKIYETFLAEDAIVHYGREYDVYSFSYYDDRSQSGTMCCFVMKDLHFSFYYIEALVR